MKPCDFFKKYGNELDNLNEYEKSAWWYKDTIVHTFRHNDAHYVNISMIVKTPKGYKVILFDVSGGFSIDKSPEDVMFWLDDWKNKEPLPDKKVWKDKKLWQELKDRILVNKI